LSPALALPVDPRVKVIGDERERESRLLCAAGIPNEVEGEVLLAGERVARKTEALAWIEPAGQPRALVDISADLRVADE
jgi:hypothetical protein